MGCLDTNHYPEGPCVHIDESGVLGTTDFVKDRWWDEDRHHTRRPGLSAMLAAINNAALSVHRLRSDSKIPVRAAADYIAWKPTIGIELLNS